MLLFLHIPKTGGITLNTIIDQQYRPDQIFQVDGTNVTASAKSLIRMSKASQKELKIARGHFAYGFHDNLKVKCHYITFLRHPLARLLSLYNYILRSPTHYAFDRVKKLSFEDFVLSGVSSETDNAQVRAVSGIRPKFGDCNQKMLKVAQKNIQTHFKFVGVTEEFGQSVKKMGRIFRWRNVGYTRENGAPKPTKVSGLTKSVSNRVISLNRYDSELYDWVCDRLSTYL